jgi:hypothetical protein
MEGMPYASLPKTFQHAVTATRQLGLRYLWIDSLCIIQDSREDWEQHCYKMPEIYRNSTVTIAGPAAVDCNTGFLHERPAPLSVNLTISNGMLEESVTLSHSGLRDPYHPNLQMNSPLEKRAWVLQERLLSPRVLYFGSEFMYFECCTNVCCEYLHFPFIDNYQSRNGVTKTSFTVEQDSRFWLQYWCQIVSTYSGAALTFNSDRLPAISGIARDIQDKLGDSYHAGLWLSDIPRGLTWYTDYYGEYTKSQDFKVGALPYVAPSWSWASLMRHVSRLVPNYDYAFVSEGIQIIGVDVKVRGSNAFGEVQEGVLTLRGRLNRFTIRLRPHMLVRERQIFFVCSDESPDLLGEYHPDEPSTLQFRKSTSTAQHNWQYPITLLYLGFFKKPGGDVEWSDWVALAIEAVAGTEDEYRRVGLAFGRQPHFPRIEGFFQESETQVLKII